MRALRKDEHEKMLVDNTSSVNDDYLDKYWEETQAHYERMRELDEDYSFEPQEWNPPQWEDRAEQTAEVPADAPKTEVKAEPREAWENSVSFEKAEQAGQRTYDYCMAQRDSDGAPMFNTSEASKMADTVSKCEAIKANANMAAAEAMQNRNGEPISQEEFEAASKRLDELRADGPAYGRVIGPDGQPKLAHESSTWERCEQYMERFEPWQNEVAQNAAIVRQYELEQQREQEKVKAEQKAVEHVEQDEPNLTPEQRELTEVHFAQAQGKQDELPGLEAEQKQAPQQEQEQEKPGQPDMASMAKMAAGVPSLPSQSQKASTQPQQEQEQEPQQEQEQEQEEME